MGGDYALKLSWGPRMCALRQSFYEAPGICLGEESLIKETQQPFMFFILGATSQLVVVTSLLKSPFSRVGYFPPRDCEQQVRKYI